ncbi:MAG: hypothetical protein ACOC80_05000 [Petrotogales bacterium]
MGIAEDLSQVFEEVGVLFTIEDTEIQEYMDFEYNVQVSNPFVREFAVDGMFKSNTSVSGGSIINIHEAGSRFLIVNFLPELFENAAIAYNATLYKCNVYGMCYRQTQTDAEKRYDSTYKTDFKWEKQFETWAPFTTDIRGISSGLRDHEDFAFINVKEKNLYLPESLDIQVGDRWYISSDEYYKIDNVERHRFNGAIICDVSEDTRGGDYAEE